MVSKMALVSFLACLACLTTVAFAAETQASAEYLPTLTPKASPGPPIKPPTYPPIKAPTTPPTRKSLSVQGVVYCKSCKYVGLPTFLGATPLAGAVVALRCTNTKTNQVTKGTTDKNGYYFIQHRNYISPSDVTKCKVSLVYSPSRICNKPTNLNGGRTGSPLMSQKKNAYLVFTVAPLAFEPAKKCY